MSSNDIELSDEFFKETLKKAKHQAGPRYTPGLKPDAPNITINELVNAIEGLGRTKEFWNEISKLQKKLSDKWGKNSLNRTDAIDKKITRRDLETLNKRLNKILSSLSTTYDQKEKLSRELDFITINKISRTTLKQLEKIITKLSERKSTEENDEKKRQLDFTLHDARELRNEIYAISSFSASHPAQLSNNPKAFLLGEAGTGKTHFLCDIADQRIQSGLPTLILLGQQLPKITDPWQQVIDSLKLKCTKTEFFEELDKMGTDQKNRVLILVDAINEGDKKGWKKNLNNFLNEINKYPGIGVILSCRTPFDKVILPRRPKPKAVTIYHQGFSDMELDAQSAFFTYYKIPTPEVPLLIKEFSNPLFLKLFCEALERAIVKEKHRAIKEISSGQMGMTYIFEFFIDKKGEQIEKALKLDNGFCWEVIKNELAPEMATKQQNWISEAETKQIISQVLQGKKGTNFLSTMVSENMLIKDVVWNQETQQYIPAIRFPYQKFSDHIIARHLLAKYLETSSAKKIKASFQKGTPLGAYFKDQFTISYNAGVIEALIIELPTRIRNKGELFDFLPTKKIPSELARLLISGLYWRHPKSINKSTDKWVSAILQHDYLRDEILDTLVALATKPQHPFNATRLDWFLTDMAMVERDLFWTEFLRRQDESSAVYRLLKWLKHTQIQNITQEFAQMYLILLMWMLTSNNRKLRDESTKTLYQLGMNYPANLFELTRKSFEINDLYIRERMLAASYGISMALHTDPKQRKEFVNKLLPDFSRWTYDNIFKKGAKYATTHILIRDYAKHLLDLTLLHHPKLLCKAELRRITPPYKDGGIRKWGRSKDRDKGEYREGNYPLGHDFENYTLGRLVSERSNYDFDNPEFKEVLENIFWRIYQLGYSLETFGQIDKEIQRYGYYMQDGIKVDRYGKKYCWIAFFELAGYRTDQGKLEDNWEDWKVRSSEADIDPSFPEPSETVEIVKADYLESGPSDLKDWLENGPVPDLGSFLVVEELKGIKGSWILLSGRISQGNKEKNRGILINIRGLLLNKSESEKFTKLANKSDQRGDSLVIGLEEGFNTFSGEIPWCETFPPSEYQVDSYGNKLPYIVKVIVGKEEKKIPIKKGWYLLDAKSKKISSSDEPVQIVEDINKGLDEADRINVVDMLHDVPTGEDLEKGYKVEEHNKEVVFEVELPARIFMWESNSVVNHGLREYVPKKELSEALRLHARPQTFDMFDHKENLATITTSFDTDYRNYHAFIFIRKDLLEEYAKGDKTLVWVIWGQRMTESRPTKDLSEIYRSNKNLFKKVILR